VKDMNINEIAEKNYLWVEEMGWHNKTTLEALALVASEVGEAINECRNEKPSDAFGEELADIILRVLDIAHWQEIDIEKKIIDKMAKNVKRGTRGRLK
jgi:NTP pyrophosphatase (non-canonical NTP hydrolase)